MDDEVLESSYTFYSLQNNRVKFFLYQCEVWRKGKLDKVQLGQVKEIEDNVPEIVKVNDKILKIINSHKKGF